MDASFEQLVAPYRRELLAHGYRMLGSPDDAEDALQETLLAAWKGMAGFEGRSSLRTWLYRISTHVCLRMIQKASAAQKAGMADKRRLVPAEVAAPRTATDDLGEPVALPWVEPLPGVEPLSDPAEHYLRRESVELAFVAALQHLPSTPRAVLLLREVLEFPAADVADLLGISTAAVNSALQRARKALPAGRETAGSQAGELARLGDDGRRDLVAAFVDAWERADVDSLVRLLADDVRFTMPPLPAWFAGRDAVRAFFAERVFATPWRLVPVAANGQLAFACYQRQDDGEYALAAVNLLSLRDGLITAIDGFLDPRVHEKFLPLLR